MNVLLWETHQTSTENTHTLRTNNNILTMYPVDTPIYEIDIDPYKLLRTLAKFYPLYLSQIIKYKINICVCKELKKNLYNNKYITSLYIKAIYTCFK